MYLAQGHNAVMQVRHKRTVTVILGILTATYVLSIKTVTVILGIRAAKDILGYIQLYLVYRQPQYPTHIYCHSNIRH